MGTPIDSDSEEETQPERSAIDGLSRIRRIAKSQGILANKTAISGMHKSPMRERLAFENETWYGAAVVSIEGDSFWQGAYMQRGVGWLGWWVSMEEVNDAWRVFFTPIDGMRFNSKGVPIKGTDFVLHTLCSEGTYLVPKDGGISVLDDGHLILLSRTGLLRGEGGWELAQEFQEKYRDLLGETSMKSMRIDQLSQEIDSIQEAFSECELERKAAIDVMKDQQLKYGRVMTTYERFQAEKDALMAQLDGLHLVHDNLKMAFRSTCAELGARVDDLMVFVETQAIDDSVRSHKSPYPKILEERKEQLRKKFVEQGGFESKDADDNKLDKILSVLQEHEERLSKTEEKSESAPGVVIPNPKPKQQQQTSDSDNRFRKGMRRVREREEHESESEEQTEGQEEEPEQENQEHQDDQQ